MRIVYVTSTLPYGSREAFLIPEVAELRGMATASRSFRCSPGSSGPRGRAPVSRCDSGVTADLRRDPPGRRRRGCLLTDADTPSPRLLLRSRSPSIFAKNLSVFAKGVWLGRRIRRLEADHLHAHWASTSSTMALVAAEISGVPWSFTAHRWDIAENNLLEIKATRACFIRAISEKGARAIASHLGPAAHNLHVIHIGIDAAERPRPPRVTLDETSLRVATVADLVEVKGHRHLLDALRILELVAASSRSTSSATGRFARSSSATSWRRACRDR